MQTACWCLLLCLTDLALLMARCIYCWRRPPSLTSQEHTKAHSKATGLLANASSSFKDSLSDAAWGPGDDVLLVFKSQRPSLEQRRARRREKKLQSSIGTGRREAPVDARPVGLAGSTGQICNILPGTGPQEAPLLCDMAQIERRTNRFDRISDRPGRKAWTV
jgi:hypothetical protein